MAFGLDTGTWLGEPLALGLWRLCAPGRILNEPGNPDPNRLGVFPMRAVARAFGLGADRRELGVRRLQASIFEPGDGKRRIAIGLAL